MDALATPTQAQQSTPEPRYPMCRCQRCQTIFRDDLDIFPGPAWCQACNEAEKAEQRKARRGRRW